MCMKTPKPKVVPQKPVQYLRNPFLDGMTIGANTGRNSLREDRAGQVPGIALAQQAQTSTFTAPAVGLAAPAPAPSP